MRDTAKIIFGSLLCLSFSIFGAPDARSEVRKIAFSPGYPTGTISVMRSVGKFTNCISQAKALGTVSIDVPSDCHISVELNPHCIEAPDKLKSMPTAGIDAIRISYMSMDENTLVVDKALAALPAWKTPLMLRCFRTDVTDAGILSFKSLNKLIRLNCFMCVIDGSFLKESKQFPNLENMSLSHNPLKTEYLKNLQDFKKLSDLNLLETNMTDAGLKEVCKVKTLKMLTIGSNPRLTAKGMESLAQCPNLEALNIEYVKNCSDEIIPTLAKLTHLNNLDLAHTTVTAAGLEKLKGLKLLKLTPPDGFKVSEMQQLQKAFPKATIFHGKEISEDVKVQFAPLK